MKLCVLGSGSKGNSTLAYTGSTALLIDAGFSAKETEKRLETISFDPARLSAILVTHEHSDHMKGVDVLARRYALSVYMTKGTRSSLNGQLKESVEVNLITSEEDFAVGDITVNPFNIPHDGVEPIGFLLESGGRKAVSITDAGFVTGIIVEKIRTAHLAVIESNHSSELLDIGPYPWHLKERISGKGGHLSNDECAELIGYAGGNLLATVIFAHLSEINNNPNLVRQEAERIFGESDVEYEIATQNGPGKVFEV